MALEIVAPSVARAEMPERESAFLRDAQTRIETFVRAGGHASFVPSDFAAAYAALRAVVEFDDLHSRAFVEWGSGFGVVAGLASMLGLDAYGIEVESDLVEAAEALVDDHDLDVRFAEGTFVPTGAERFVDESEGAWLDAGGQDAYEDLDLEPDDFGVVFAYPWPGNEEIYEALFDHYAASGAYLILHRGLEGTTIQRKQD